MHANSRYCMLVLYKCTCMLHVLYMFDPSSRANCPIRSLSSTERIGHLASEDDVWSGADTEFLSDIHEGMS